MTDRQARQARINRFADATARRVSDAEGKEGRLDTPDSQLGVIVRSCGFQKRSPQILRDINQALLARGIVTNPPITDPVLPLDQRIYFYRSPQPVPPAACRFATERALEEFIVINFGLIDAFRGLDLIKQQYKLPTGQRIDLLCRDADSDDLVIVELKHDAADQGVVAQVFMYLDALKPRAARKGVGVRAMLISGEGNDALQAMIRHLSEVTGFRVDWHTYSAMFRLSPAG